VLQLRALNAWIQLVVVKKGIQLVKILLHSFCDHFPPLKPVVRMEKCRLVKHKPMFHGWNDFLGIHLVVVCPEVAYQSVIGLVT